MSSVPEIPAKGSEVGAGNNRRMTIHPPEKEGTDIQVSCNMGNIPL